eukprot:CAMPEP_0180551930 /NCGR_PEP_ID=MMETSP1036_2-20121128/73465_1 /TAXON_ID=632150 /ORGANISM="Azadinium spinosum, Strain 3D9" /LENGTH=34 /DNA_ID= /DNA_START= /DNA_END= /DNA_ORIENTATION=
MSLHSWFTTLSTAVEPMSRLAMTTLPLTSQRMSE